MTLAESLVAVWHRFKRWLREGSYDYRVVEIEHQIGDRRFVQVIAVVDRKRFGHRRTSEETVLTSAEVGDMPA